jgi:hypothetical protein
MWFPVYPTALRQSLLLCYNEGEQNDIVITRMPYSAAGADELLGVSSVCML